MLKDTGLVPTSFDVKGTLVFSDGSEATLLNPLWVRDAFAGIPSVREPFITKNDDGIKLVREKFDVMKLIK